MSVELLWELVRHQAVTCSMGGLPPSSDCWRCERLWIEFGVRAAGCAYSCPPWSHARIKIWALQPTRRFLPAGSDCWGSGSDCWGSGCVQSVLQLDLERNSFARLWIGFGVRAAGRCWRGSGSPADSRAAFGVAGISMLVQGKAAGGSFTCLSRGDSLRARDPCGALQELGRLEPEAASALASSAVRRAGSSPMKQCVRPQSRQAGLEQKRQDDEGWSQDRRSVVHAEPCGLLRELIL